MDNSKPALAISSLKDDVSALLKHSEMIFNVIEVVVIQIRMFKIKPYPYPIIRKIRISVFIKNQMRIRPKYPDPVIVRQSLETFFLLHTV